MTALWGWQSRPESPKKGQSTPGTPEKEDFNEMGRPRSCADASFTADAIHTVMTKFTPPDHWHGAARRGYLFGKETNWLTAKSYLHNFNSVLV